MRSQSVRLLPSLAHTAWNTAQHSCQSLVHQERQHHERGKHHREILRAMPVVVLKVIALIFQCIARLVFHVPARPTIPHEVIHVALAHPQVRHPAEVLDLVSAYFPVLIKLTCTSGFEALSGMSCTKRNRWTTPAARLWRSEEVTCPACSAACKETERHDPPLTPRIECRP